MPFEAWAYVYAGKKISRFLFCETIELESIIEFWEIVRCY